MTSSCGSIAIFLSSVITRQELFISISRFTSVNLCSADQDLENLEVRWYHQNYVWSFHTFLNTSLCSLVVFLNRCLWWRITLHGWYHLYADMEIFFVIFWSEESKKPVIWFDLEYSGGAGPKGYEQVVFVFHFDRSSLQSMKLCQHVISTCEFFGFMVMARRSRIYRVFLLWFALKVSVTPSFSNILILFDFV